MVNITLSVEEDLLAKAKAAAKLQHTSLNQWVRSVLDQRLRSADERQSLDDWFWLADGASQHPDPLPPGGGRDWSRDGLYRQSGPS